MAATLLTWCAYASLLVVRYGLGWRGRRVAFLLLAGFALVVTVHVALPASHFT